MFVVIFTYSALEETVRAELRKGWAHAVPAVFQWSVLAAEFLLCELRKGLVILLKTMKLTALMTLRQVILDGVHAAPRRQGPSGGEGLG